jgi:transcriptional regulator with XRE-family HTH domain
MDKETIERVMAAAYARRGGRCGMTLRSAAIESGISFTTLSRIETGHTPDLATFKKLCLWTGVSADFLLGLKPESDKRK